MTLKFSVNFDEIRKRKEAHTHKAAFRKGATQTGENTAYIADIFKKTLGNTKKLLVELQDRPEIEPDTLKAEKYRLQVLITELEHNIQMLEQPPQEGAGRH